MFVNYPPIEYINIPKIGVYESVGYSNDIYSNGHTSYLVYSDTPFIVSHNWGVFRNLKELQVGDEVDLSGEYGWRRYEVKDKVILHYPQETTFTNAKYISDKNETEAVIYTCDGDNRLTLYLERKEKNANKNNDK